MKRIIQLDFNKFGAGIWQRNYMRTFNKEYTLKRLIPNTILINDHGEKILEINSDGFKGSDFLPANRLIFIWGDSCVFGCGLDSWVDHIRFSSGFESVNGGVEGNHILAVRDLALEAARRFKNRIAAQFIYGSWHPLYDKFDQSMWETAYRDICLTDIPTILATLPSPIRSMKHNEFRDLLEEITLAQGDNFDAVLIKKKTSSGSKKFQSFLGKYNLDQCTYNLIRENLFRLDQVIQKIALETGSLMYDLSSRYAPQKIDEFPNYFFDAVHPDPDMYDLLGCLVGEGLIRLNPEMILGGENGQHSHSF